MNIWQQIGNTEDEVLDTLYQLYHVDGLSTRKIGKMYGISHTAIEHKLKNDPYGKPLRGRGGAHNNVTFKATMLQYVQQQGFTSVSSFIQYEKVRNNLSERHIAQKHSLSPNYVHRALQNQVNY